MNEDQAAYMNRLLGCSRLVYNNLLSYKNEQYESGNKISPSQLSKRLTELKTQESFSFLRDVHSKVLQQSLLDLNMAFANFFSKRAKFPTFKSRKHKQSCRFPIDAIFKNPIKGNRISLIKSLKDVHFKCSRADEKYLNKNKDKIKSATLSKTKSGKYFLSILIDKPNRVNQSPINEVIGIDLGIKTFATLSTGEIILSPSLSKLESKLERLHKKHSKKIKGSKNREKARIKIAKQYEKISNVKSSFLHQTTSKLVSENQTIVLEDLNVSGMMKNHKLARSIQRLGLFEFRRQIEYKSKWYNRRVVHVNRFFPSSKLCSNCGHKKESLMLSERTYVCDNCNVSIDRDLNASINLLKEGKRILGLSSPEVKLVDCSLMDDKVVTPLKSHNRMKQEKNVVHVISQND